MNQFLSGLIISFALATPAWSATVGVVDSGTDFSHQGLLANAWTNPLEVAGNRLDDDRNGKVDDFNGWNFIDGYSKVFVSDHLTSINPLAYKIMKIIAHQQAGTATEEEMAFFKENVSDLGEVERKALIAHLNYFGQYLHGTHVAGIVASLSPEAEIMAARVFADEPPPTYNASTMDFRAKGVLDWIYKLLAVAANGNFVQIGEYLNQTEMDVANYSLGMSLSAIAEQFLKLKGNANPSEEEIAAEAKRIYAQFEEEGKKWLASAPNTLFVIAAGNDGTDNDVLPAFPANIRVGNSISVAASLGYREIAEFSNYGLRSVDVAAPGVAIESTVPSLDGKAMLPLSGTSMAAPFVAGVAARVKDANSALTPAQMRDILMGTVDKKDWLKEKVVSGGVVNPERAEKAAALSITMPVAQAIDEARSLVVDKAEMDHGPKAFDPRPADSILTELSKKLVF